MGIFLRQIMIDVKTWIKHCEDLKTQTYIDTTGNITIGWGRNLSNGISLDEAELMFENDFNRCEKELMQYSWYLTQPEGVQDALLNMNFNLGIERLLSFKKMIRALINRNYTDAAIEALDSTWANQVGQRARDIALMIREGK
jgi:lysozyme